MSNSTKKTKRNLTIIFSLIVFFVILSLWTTYFSVKYFRYIWQENFEFSRLVNLVEEGKLSIEDIMWFWKRYEINILNPQRQNDNIKLIIPNPNYKPKGFINYIYFDSKNNLISSNVKDEIGLDLVHEINENEKYLWSNQINWFLVKKFIVLDNNWTFIILKKLDYNISNYLSDLFWYIFITLLFSILLYFIWFRFVNKAFVPVEENIKDMKNFIHNAGHELKTPISVIDSNLQLIDDIKIYDPQMIWEMKNEVKRLNSLIDSLIDLSDIDAFKDLENLNLKETLEEIISWFKFKIQEKDLKIEIDLWEEIIVKANKNYFYIFLSNLIWNAIKYNKNSWKINISYKSWNLVIDDTWIWIKKEDLDKIFDRFFKSDKSRNTDWFGIWLSLVKKIADIYKWKIKVKSEEDKWTKVLVSF